MEQKALTTSKLPKETEQQYTAFLLYAEIGSLERLLNYWQRTEGRPKATERRPELEALMGRLGKSPALTTLKEWSIKYQWVKRKEIKIAEDLEILRERTKKIKRGKIHKIAEIFERITNKILKWLKGDYEPTISEWKMAWEMFQVELGKPTTRTQLNTEPEQRPLTPEEKERGKEHHEAMAWYLEQQHKKKIIKKTSKKT